MPTERQLTVQEACAEIAGLPSIGRGVAKIIVHHTWEPSAVDYRGIQTVAGIRRYHINAKGWSDNGYHILFGPSGEVFFARPFSRIGAHCRGQNAGSIGVSYIADFGGPADGRRALDNPTTYAGLAAGQLVVAELCSRFGFAEDNVYFHSDYSTKTCPGTLMDREEYRQVVGIVLLHPPPADVSPWAESGVDWAIENNIMTRNAAGLFRGQANVTRQEQAVICHRLWNLFYERGE